MIKMKRYAAQVEYLGTHYSGWQRQGHTKTVQGCVEQAISTVANHIIEVQCAGRTDAGVHATAQVIHFDSASPRTIKSWLLGTNANLPEDIRIIWVVEVDETFHARFSAESRTYRYIIYTRSVATSILKSRVTWVKKPLNVVAMNGASQYLLGEQDFTSFRAANCQSTTPMRNIMETRVTKSGKFIVFEIKGNAFLYHMVRNIIGTLIDVGLDHKPSTWVKPLLLLKDRNKASPTAAPDGLYLVSVSYPSKYGLPQSDLGPCFL
jgi:tRNA pseudouridine38-40 synthase